MRISRLVSPSLVSLFALAACEAVPHDPDPGEIGEAIDDALRGITGGTTTEQEIAYRVVDLRDTAIAGSITAETCDGVDVALDDVCSDLVAAGQADGCGRITSFYYAHAVPRCGVRLYLHSNSAGQAPRTNVPWIYALDFTGEPLSGPEPQCGNGELDAGEMCDDGNFELWDGCDSNCKIEEFNGCEAVIEQAYAVAGLARVDASTWEARRSQLMVNTATAMQPVGAQMCAEAGALVDTVCDELVAQMPFVSTCGGSYRYDAAVGPGCAVRFEVGFRGRAPASGVFTTSMSGVLTFTIR